MSRIIYTDAMVVSVCLQGVPAVHHAAFHQEADLVKLLLLLGTDVQPTRLGHTSLCLCQLHHHVSRPSTLSDKLYLLYHTAWLMRNTLEFCSTRRAIC